MKSVQISLTERVIISRHGTDNSAQYQRKETNGWETVHCKCYPGDWKGKIAEDVVGDYKNGQGKALFIEGECDIDPFNFQ